MVLPSPLAVPPPPLPALRSPSWKNMPRRRQLRRHPHLHPPIVAMPIITIMSRAHLYQSRQQPRLPPVMTDRYSPMDQTPIINESRMTTSQRLPSTTGSDLISNSNSRHRQHDQGHLWMMVDMALHLHQSLDGQRLL